MWAAVSIHVPEIDRVITTDPDRGIATANAARNGVVNPGQAVVSRNGCALTSGPGAAGGVWHVNGAIGPDLHVTVNSPIAFHRIKYVDARAKGQASVVAPRAFRSHRRCSVS